jgi:hypothetical protein
MAISLISSTIAGSTNQANVTTSAINTTGASLIVLVVVISNTQTTDPTDSAGNTWTALTLATAGASKERIYYCVSPTTSSTHTFSLSATFVPSIGVMAFSGTSTSSPFDQQSTGTQNFGFTCQTGSVTPSVNGELLISGVSFQNSNTVSIDSSFNTPLQVNNSSNNLGIGMAYLVQSTAAAINPTWTYTNVDAGACSIATFKAASVGSVFGLAQCDGLSTSGPKQFSRVS